MAAVAVVEKSILDRNWVLEACKRNYERAMQLEEVLDKSGKVVRLDWDGNVANKAIEIVARVVGAFNEESTEQKVPKAAIPEWLAQEFRNSKDEGGPTVPCPAPESSTPSKVVM